MAPFEGAPVALARLEGRQHRYIAANAAYRRFVGVGDIWGRAAADVLPGGAEAAQLGLFQQVFDTGRAAVVHDWHAVDPADPAHPHGRPFRVSATPVRGAGGEVTGLDVVAQPSEDVDKESAHASVLPQGVVVHPGLAVAAGAVVSEDDDAARGDWFDSWTLADGRVAFVIGDVVGEGRSTLATVSRLRAVVPMALDRGDDPAAALGRLASYAVQVPEVVGTTVCVAVVDAASGRLTYASAGHPPPVVVSRSGTPSVLDESGDACLGIGTTFRVCEHTLGPGDLLLLLSDGVLESRGRTAQESLEIVGRSAAAALRRRQDDAQAVDDATHDVLHAVAQPVGFWDDAVVVAALRRASPVQPLSLVLPTIPDTVTAVRHDLGDWLASTGMGPIDASSLLQAVGELVANAVEHAYPAGTDHRETEVRVRCALAPDGVVEIEVADSGRWKPYDAPQEPPVVRRPPADAARGRGLYLAQAFVDELDVRTSPAGTTCRVRHRPYRPATVLAQRPVAGLPAEPAMDFRADLDGDVLVVRGAVDTGAADRLRLLIGRASLGGTRPLTLDLTGATLLASAVVEVLVATRAGLPGGVVSLVAGPGSAALRALRLAGLAVTEERPTPRP